MSEYLPVEHFREHDYDKSSFPIRDFPKGKARKEVRIYPEAIAFPGTMVETSSAIQSILVHNTGVEDVVIVEVRTSGPFALTNTNPFKLAPGEIRELQVTFGPVYEGATSGGVYVDSGDAAGDEFVRLTGIGAAEGTVIVQPSVFRDVVTEIRTGISRGQNDPAEPWAKIANVSLPAPTETRKVILVIYTQSSNLTAAPSIEIEGRGVFSVLTAAGGAVVPIGSIEADSIVQLEWTGEDFRLVA